MQPSIHTIYCRPDEEGDVVATLVHYPARADVAGSRRAVLYLHGFVDYFFQEHVAEAFAAHGYDFYALDLRKCGRSLRPHQHPNYCRSLEEYSEEIGAAIARIGEEGHSDLTLIGHSTGGLIASLYAATGARRHAIQRLVLNSPFFEFNESAFTRSTAFALSRFLAGRSRYAVMPQGLSPMYVESLHVTRRGEWNHSLEWKPVDGFPVYAAWVVAVHEGQLRLQRGLGLTIPVLLLHSDRSMKAKKRWRDEFKYTDAVLNVDHMKKYGPRLGDHVEMVEIPGGMHDLYLSRADVRALALQKTLDWVDAQTAATTDTDRNRPIQEAQAA